MAHHGKNGQYPSILYFDRIESMKRIGPSGFVMIKGKGESVSKNICMNDIPVKEIIETDPAGLGILMTAILSRPSHQGFYFNEKELAIVKKEIDKSERIRAIES